METLKIKKTTPYGVQLEDDSYRKTTQQVRDFLRTKCPCEAQVTETKNDEISKVKMLSTTPQPARLPSYNQERIEEAMKSKQASVMISYAKDLAVAKIIKPEEISSWSASFMALQEELIKGTIKGSEEPVISQEIKEEDVII